MVIETENLQLIACDADILKTAISGNAQLAEKLGVIVLDNWTEFGVEALQYSHDKLMAHEAEKGWWTYFPIYKPDNRLIGSGGYQGKPSAGIVEIGYEISPEFRNRGLATEMTQGLVAHAFKDDAVHTVIAHTLGEENPSTKVLAKCGFVKTKDINHPEEGLIWKWELKKG